MRVAGDYRGAYGDDTRNPAKREQQNTQPSALVGFEVWREPDQGQSVFPCFWRKLFFPTSYNRSRYTGEASRLDLPGLSVHSNRATLRISD